jgi:chromate transporter
MASVSRTPHPPNPLFEVAWLFLRLGASAFGGPAAHVALIERECVERRQWLSREEFLDLLGVANLIPGPTSTELAMHVGRRRAGWPGLVVAGVAFIAPAALLVGALAAIYVRAGDLPSVRGVLTAVQPVVVVVVLDALLPLARTAIRSAATVAIAAGAAAMLLAGLPEIVVLLLGGALHLLPRRRVEVALLLGSAVPAVVRAASRTAADAPDVFAYFAGVGSLLFGSGYVLLPVLEGDLVQRRGWLTPQQLLDAVAAGQATPGPLFTTATFIGYVLGGPWVAFVATAGMFLPAFLFSAIGSLLLERLRRSEGARAFLKGVNAAAVVLIASVLVTLVQAVLTTPLAAGAAAAAAVLIRVLGVSPSLVLLGAAAAGAGLSLAGVALE